MRMKVFLLSVFVGTTVLAADAPRPTVTRNGSLSGFGDTSIKFPASGVERAPRVTAEDGGYLDLARSKDGRELWTRRWWDDGSADVNHFQLNWAEDRKLILQFVDGVVESWPEDRTPREALGRRVLKRPDGSSFEQILDAWPVDPQSREAFSLSTHTWVPLVPARKESATDAGKIQWMVFAASCPEVNKACVYYGKPADVCGRYFDVVKHPGEAALWIAPKGPCRGHR
jgi:hypothetical protein